jgi:hypothetical protein
MRAHTVTTVISDSVKTVFAVGPSFTDTVSELGLRQRSEERFVLINPFPVVVIYFITRNGASCCGPYRRPL